MISVDDLLLLARQEARPSGKGRPIHTILRRAVSTAYYAIFHALCEANAKEFVGIHRNAAAWKTKVIFYRALDHGKTRERCQRASAGQLSLKLQNSLGIVAFPQDLRDFAETFVSLQEMRHACDYDPEFSVSKREALLAVTDAEKAISILRLIEKEDLRLFLAFLLHDIRG
jgi:hypothetical protein